MNNAKKGHGIKFIFLKLELDCLVDTYLQDNRHYLDETSTTQEAFQRPEHRIRDGLACLLETLPVLQTRY